MKNKKIITSFTEFVIKENAILNEPKVKPTVKPDVKPNPTKKPFDPIRRDKPSVTPAPKAKKEEDVVDRFEAELNMNPDREIPINMKQIRNKYSKK